MPTSTLNLQFNTINVSLQSIATALRNQSFFNSQLFAGIIGALVGILPFLYTLYKERPIIKVMASQDWLIYPSGRLHNILTVRISNSGRRPINLTVFFLKYSTGESLVFIDESSFIGGSGLPRKLEEGNSHAVRIGAGSISRSVLEKNDYPIAACYTDALNTVYGYKLSKDFWERFFKAGHSKK